MELNKKTEQYKLEDFYQEKGWSITGDVFNNTDGSFSSGFEVLTENKDFVGILNFTKNKNGRFNVNYEVSEENRLEFVKHLHILIDSVLAHFK